MIYTLRGHTLCATPTHLIPPAFRDVESGACRALLAAVLEGRPDGGADDVGNVGRFVDEVEVLPSTLSNKARKGPGRDKESVQAHEKKTHAHARTHTWAHL